MPYFKDTSGAVYWLDSASEQSFLPGNCVQITDVEADTLRSPSLAQVKASKVAEIEAKRDEATNADVAALGTLWQADERSQKLLSSSITLAQAGLPLPSVWRDALNNNLAITSLSQLLAIAGAIAVQTDASYTKSWQLKAQIDAATTVVEVDAIIW